MRRVKIKVGRRGEPALNMGERKYRAENARRSQPQKSPRRERHPAHELLFDLAAYPRGHYASASGLPNITKHVCVAARICEGKVPGASNSRSIAKTSNAAIADSGCNPSGWHGFL